MLFDWRDKTHGLFIGGREVAPSTGEAFPVHNPQDGALLAQAARATQADVELIVARAREGAELWAALPPADRERVLLRAADVIESHAAELINLIIMESGSTIAKARYEVFYSASLLRAAAGEARRLYGDTFPNDRPHRLSIVLREPLGVVVAISPFNAPLALLVKMVAFPLAAANAVIAKPSEETPLIALALARCFQQVGMPDGVFSVASGYGHEIGAALVEHPHVQGIAFTGSTATGVRIGQAAMKTMKRLQLELGGKNPLIVWDDVDIDAAARMTAVGAFYHAGQICMSGSRVLVSRRIAEDFAQALADRARGLYLGDLRDEKTAYGPLINPRALDKTQAHVRAALAAGAQLLCGGAVHHGLTYQPTVLYNTPRDNVAWCEETFGPVVNVVPVADLDEAIALANDSMYGLSAGILTRDIQRALTAARRIKAGAVHIGLHPFQSDSLAPVGGFGFSGIGRSGGRYSVEHFTELKWISVELGEPPLPF